MDATTKGLEDAGVAMPAFGNVENALQKELKEDPIDFELLEKGSQKHLQSFRKKTKYI